MDIAGFLSRYPPFNGLEPERVSAIAANVQVEHFAAGARTLSQEGDPAHALYVIRKGAVELVDGGDVLDLLSEGEVFGQFSLLACEGPTLSLRAQEDTLCYLIAPQDAAALRGTTAEPSFVLGSIRRRIRAASDGRNEEPPDRRYRPIGELIRRPVVWAEADMTVTEAAKLMTRERISSLLVRGDAIGILTDRDLRSRVIASGAAADTLVAAVSTVPAKTLPSTTLASEALLAMFAYGVHRFPVTDALSGVIGVVTDIDLLDLGRYTPIAVKRSIERAGDAAGVASAARELPDVVCAMVEASADPVDVGRVVALTTDAATRQLLHLGIAQLGDAPAPWAWLALGGQGRQEQALHTDQDHALAFDPQGGSEDDLDPYFADLAEFVTAGLEAAGVPRCGDDIMANHRLLRRSLDGWTDAFRRWMREPGVDGTILSSIACDFRQIAGPLEAEPSLHAVIREAAGAPDLLRHLAHRALDRKPPTGFFRDLVLGSRGEHTGRLDIKRDGIGLVCNLARATAIIAGVSDTSTVAKLRAAAAAGTLDGSIATELVDAFGFLWDVRLRHQVGQVRGGLAPDDFIDPASLGTMVRIGLKEAFRVISRAQRQVASELGVDMR
ncbi:MAG: putative nucleotidyltransferase substrate binding domain-containing protein [Actinomycetota bacterium]